MLTSNLTTIISRVERMKVGLPAAAGRAIAVDYWRPRLESAAAKTLRAQWALEKSVAKRELYERRTPELVKTITGELLEGPVARFTLGQAGPAPNGGNGNRPVDLAAAISGNAEGRTPATGERSKNFRLPIEEQAARGENLEAVREGILEWVQLEKRKETEPGGRDAGLSDEQIAERLEFILGLGQTVKQRSDLMDEAAKSLTPVIQDFLERWQEGGNGSHGVTSPTSVDPEVIEEWLGAVLLAWHSLVLLSLPARLQYEVARELKRIEETFL